MKRIIGIVRNIMLIILLIGVSGCMKESPKEEMLKYMEEKYNEKFEVYSYNSQSYFAGHTELLLKSPKFKDVIYPITVRKSKESGVIADNYVEFLMKEKIEKEFEDILSQVYEEYKVFYIPGRNTLPHAATPNMSVAEFSKVKGTNMIFQIAVYDENMDDKEEKIEKLRSMLESKQYRCRLYVFYMLEGKLDKLTESNRNEVFNSDRPDYNWAKMRGYFSMDKNYKFTDTSEWREL